ncbi:VanZ family protein [Ruminococcaceae bacterium OttesenSCG-928-A11]|nr:VanZ family protein [Ruminococcaceae bacterium OttesenSCG-928-A11]
MGTVRRAATKGARAADYIPREALMAAYLTMLAVAMLVPLPLYYLIRRGQNRRRATPPHPAREVLLALFVLFCGALAALLFDGFAPWHWAPQSVGRALAGHLSAGEGVNLVPLRTIGSYLAQAAMSGGRMALSVVNLAGNVVMFVPLGLMLPLLWRRWQRWWKMLLLAVLLPVGVEVVQLALPRGVDVDDVLLNAVGIVLGWGLYLLAARLFPRLRGLAASRAAQGRRDTAAVRPAA